MPFWGFESQLVATIHHDANQAPLELQPRFVMSQFLTGPLRHNGVDRPIGFVQPRRKSEDGWYHVAIDVNAQEAMRASFQREDAAILTREVRLAQASTIGKERGKGDLMNTVVPLFAPRGSLGLYFHYGTFSVRNVKVTPQPAADGG